MKIIVLGASGQIGSVLWKGLKHFHDVIGTSRNSSREYLQFNPFADDWSALGQADVLINCVGQIAATAANSFYRIHVELAKLIIANREKLGHPRIIQLSALGASARHDVEFLKTKGMADEHLLQHANVTVVRPSIVCTHRTMIVKKMLMLSKMSRFLLGHVPVPKGFLQTRIQPIMPQDLVDVVHQACLSKQVRTIDAVGPERISFREIIQFVIAHSVKGFKVIEVPRALSDVLVKHLISPLLPQLVNFQQYQLLFRDNIADVTPCVQLLGRNPKSCKEFLEHEFQLN